MTKHINDLQLLKDACIARKREISSMTNTNGTLKRDMSNLKGKNLLSI